MTPSSQLFSELARSSIEQHGLLTRDQLRDGDASDQQIKSWVRSGLIERVEPGIYLVAGRSRTWQARLLAECLRTGARASHRAAAALADLDGFGPGILEVTIARLTSLRRAGVLVHESTDLHLVDLTVVRGIPTTPVARTLLDLGAVVPPFRVERAVLDAVSRRLTTWPELLVTLDRHSARGRRGCGVLRSVLDEHFGDGAESQIERRFERMTRRAGLPSPVQQVEVFDDDGFIMRLDFGYRPWLVAVEIDSVKHHATATAFEEDRRKRNRLRIAGWLLLEFTSKRLRCEPTNVCREVSAALRSRAHLVPPPPGPLATHLHPFFRHTGLPSTHQ